MDSQQKNQLRYSLSFSLSKVWLALILLYIKDNLEFLCLLLYFLSVRITHILNHALFV